MIDDPHIERQPALGQHRDNEFPQAPLYLVPFRDRAHAVSGDIEDEYRAQHAAWLSLVWRRASSLPTAGPSRMSSPRIPHFATLVRHSL
jgi:hypothetical protein